MAYLAAPAMNIATYQRAYLRPKLVLSVAFVVLLILEDTARRREVHVRQDSLSLAASDLAKAMLSLFMWFIAALSSRTISARADACSEEHPELPTYSGIPSSYSDGEETISFDAPSTKINLALGSVRSTLSISVVGIFYTLRAYTNIQAQEFVDPFALYLAFPVTILGILGVLRMTCWRNFPSAFYHACILQFAGFFISRDAIVGSILPDCNPLVAFAVSNSIWMSLVDLVYQLHRSSSVHFINTVIFAQSSIVHLLLFILHPPHSILNPFDNYFVSVLRSLPLIEAAKDIVMMLIIAQCGVLSQGILISLGSTLLIVVDTWRFTKATYSAYLGCLTAIVGSGIFVLHRLQLADQQQDIVISVRRFFAATVTFLVAAGYIGAVVFHYYGMISSSWWTQSSGLSTSHPDCRVPQSSNLIHSQTIANYSHFTNVLLVVFFSHPRYDANLDFHREVYADYFPNIVYIGPASREDKGFAHSYDVLVDSFQSEEDLSNPLFYQMAGRMAHHMLYTALREYDCYDGYLWVPFDTLLNIPRLQQFNQSLFWYHSPWGQPVPNPAFGNITELELNSSRHAPPAMISPDPSVNLTETWRGWGPDWWWGDPHVGVSVCMPAFSKVPKTMREHLTRRLDGQTRLIGGSADTLYIPGRHRKALMDVLALFLETDCFLEIATPTAVHLVVPPEETIQFVDHWWIYQPPFNASFVRQKWAQGYEVDTFHTFHWGERGEDGVWRSNHDHVADVRHLLQESAIRQGLSEFPVTDPALES